jgi:hypothetical protein
MHTAVRPWITTGVALVGASVIAVTPVAPPPQAFVPQVHIPEVHMPHVQLTASVLDIFTFPAFRQYVVNQIDDLVTLGVGLAGSAAGLGQSIVAIPSTLVTATQQVLSGDLLGALTTVQNYLVGSIVAVGEPTLDAIIERRQRVLAVAEALQLAVPQAFFSVVGGFGGAADTVLRAFIVAGQDLVDAVLSFSPGAIASALVNGTTLVLGSFIEGGQQVVDGIVDAQQTIATALAATPNASMTTLSAKVSPAEVTDVPDLSRKTAMVAVSPSADTTDAVETTSATTKSDNETESGSTEKMTPKAADDADQSAAGDTTSTSADKTDEPGTKAPKDDTETKGDDSSKHETKKADNESQSEGAKQK